MKSWQRRTIGILTLGGAATGITIVLSQMVQSQLSIGAFIVSSIFLAICGLGIAAGVFVLEDDDRANQFAIPFWLLQVPVLSSAWISYEMSTGARFNVLINSGLDFRVIWGVGSQFSLYLFPEAPLNIGVNAIAIVVCLALVRARSKTL
ncbi:MAG: hypothetical protein WD078_02240 [Woeseia sp.]